MVFLTLEKILLIWAGFAYPTVSASDTQSQNSASVAAMRTTSSSGTAPCSVQPNAVDTAPSISTPGRGCAAHLRTSSIICSGVMRTLDSLCRRLAETGNVTLCAPASRAR